MSKRKSSSAKESPNKRVRPDQEQEEDRDAADVDQDGHLVRPVQVDISYSHCRTVKTVVQISV